MMHSNRSGIQRRLGREELTEKGLRTIMLRERQDHEHIKDYKTADKILDFCSPGKVTQQELKDHPLYCQDWAATEAVIDSWAKDVDCPIGSEALQLWRAYRLGAGRSCGSPELPGAIMTRGQCQDGCHRTGLSATRTWSPGMIMWSDLRVSAGARGGRGCAIAGRAIPPPMEMNCVEKDVRRG